MHSGGWFRFRSGKKSHERKTNRFSTWIKCIRLHDWNIPKQNQIEYWTKVTKFLFYFSPSLPFSFLFFFSAPNYDQNWNAFAHLFLHCNETVFIWVSEVCTHRLFDWCITKTEFRHSRTSTEYIKIDTFLPTICDNAWLWIWIFFLESKCWQFGNNEHSNGYESEVSVCCHLLIFWFYS